MSKRDMGGPAFPVPYEFISRNDQGNILSTEGMTLWDYYAAAAPISRASAFDHAVDQRLWKHEPVNLDLMYQHMAKQAAKFAGAMLAERAKRTEES